MEKDVQADELRQVFRDNLKTRREELGLTQVALADRLGVGQPYISDLEAGRKRPLVDTLADIAEALETTPAYFLTPIGVTSSALS